MTESQPFVHCGPHLWLLRNKFICACTKSSEHAHGTKFRGGNFKHFKTSLRPHKVMDGPATDSQDCKRNSGDPRTGMFHEMANIACSVTGVF